jgi:hypothetical protein
MMLEVLWLVGPTSAYQCARALVVGEKSIHCDCSAGKYRTELLAVHEFSDPGVCMADEVGDVFDRHP